MTTTGVAPTCHIQKGPVIFIYQTCLLRIFVKSKSKESATETVVFCAHFMILAVYYRLVFLSVRSLETGQCRLEALLLLQGVVIKNRTAHASVIETQTLENFRSSQRVFSETFFQIWYTALLQCTKSMSVHFVLLKLILEQHL